MRAVCETVSILCNDENYVPSHLLNSNARLINMKNGLLDIKTMELLPHDPKVYSTIQLPIEYDPNAAVTPIFDSYLDTLCGRKNASCSNIWGLVCQMFLAIR